MLLRLETPEFDKEFGEVKEYLVEINNMDESCEVLLTPLLKVIQRGMFGGGQLWYCNKIYESPDRVLVDHGPDFMMYVVSKLSGKLFLYDCVMLNYHHWTNYICSGIINKDASDMTVAQRAATRIDVGQRYLENKVIGHIGVTQLLVLLQNDRVRKRSRREADPASLISSLGTN